MAIKSNITTPLRKETYKSLQLNAGVMLVDFDLSTYNTATALKAALKTAIQGGTKLLGATRGGGTFNITRDIRQVEADGVRSAFVGSEIVDSADAALSTTILEITPAHIKTILGNADIDEYGSLGWEVTVWETCIRFRMRDFIKREFTDLESAIYQF